MNSRPKAFMSLINTLERTWKRYNCQTVRSNGRWAVRNPFPSGHKPELDVTPELNDDLGSRFLQLIGILRWTIELGRLDIFVEVSQLSQHQALPRRGHLEALYHIFAYLKKHENGARIVFDPKTPDIDVQCECRLERFLRGRLRRNAAEHA